MSSCKYLWTCDCGSENFCHEWKFLLGDKLISLSAVLMWKWPVQKLLLLNAYLGSLVLKLSFLSLNPRARSCILNVCLRSHYSPSPCFRQRSSAWWSGSAYWTLLLTDVEGEANSQKARSLRNLIPGFQSSLTLKHPGSIKVLENEVPEALPSLPLGEICSLETI